MKKKITLSPESEHVWLGVCGGLARHYDIDPVYARIAFFVLFLTSGLGLLLYTFLWVAMPVAEEDQD